MHKEAESERDDVLGDLDNLEEASAFIEGLNEGRMVEEYKVGSRLAPKVDEVRNQVTGVVYVRYRLWKRDTPCHDAEKIRETLSRLQQIEHPNVCPLLEAFDDGGRTLSYAIIGDHPLPFDNYLSTIKVVDQGDACTVEFSCGNVEVASPNTCRP